MFYPVEIGKNVTALRKQKGMSQEALAFEANICVTSLKLIEHGRVNATMDTLESIARALDVEPPVLYWLALSEAEILEKLRDARKGFVSLNV